MVTAPRVGAVGFISVLFPFLLPLGLVRVDEETREPVRAGTTVTVTVIVDRDRDHEHDRERDCERGCDGGC